MILLISNSVRQQLISKRQNCAFYSIIVDTTGDITKHDQVSIVLRWVRIERDKITIEETFLGFLHAMNPTAQGLAELVSKWLIDHELVLSKIRKQGYDGASVMSGKAEGVQKRFQDVITSNQENGDNARAPFVHCTSHNLN